MRRLLIPTLIAVCCVADLKVSAATLNDVEYADQIKVGEKSLLLNGLGIRKKDKFGLTFKVYVGALYLPKKSQSADEILAMTDLRVLKMTFVRRVDGKDLATAFEDGHGNNCPSSQSGCEASKKQLLTVTRVLPDIMDKGTMEFQFFPDRVEYDIKGRKNLKGTLQGADISKNFLAIFIGKTPPTEELKKGLLGQK